MKSRNGAAAAIASLLLGVSCVLCVPTLHAQATPVDADAREPVLALAVEPGLVSADALRAQLESELGVRVASAAVAPPSTPTLTLKRLPSGSVEVALTARLVPRASREVVLHAQREEERVETLALIAANLVRNEAASLLPDLRPAQPSAPVASAPPPPPPPAPPPCRLKKPTEFGFDFAPGAGSSSSPAGRAATRSFSLGFVGTLSAGLQGFEASIGANIKSEGMCGFQGAVGANLVFGPVQGAQAALFNLARGDVHGVQYGIANMGFGSLRGLQAGIANLNLEGIPSGMQGGVLNYAGGRVRGLQGGIANYAGGPVEGMQGGVANFALGGVRGAQLGVANVALGDLSGMQAGVVNFALGHAEHLQAGVANYGRGVDGMQGGVLNVSSGAVRGLQLGVVNYAERSDASIGVLSIVRRGRTSVDALAAVEDGVVVTAITHGGRYWHNSYGVGIRPEKGEDRLVTLLAIGARALHRERVRLDIDLFTTHHLRLADEGRTTMVSGVRVPVTIMLVHGLGIVAAPSFQVMVTDDPEEKARAHLGKTKLEGGDTRVYAYPGLSLGLRWEFDHGA